MNAYRVALILCHTVIISLWWSAGIRLFSVLLGAVVNLLSASAHFFAPGVTLFSAVPFAVGAIFLQIFSASLAASMIGSATLEGETIASRNGLEPPERALAVAGAGLFLLFFGAATVLPSILSVASLLLRPNNGNTLVGYIGFLIPTILQCLVGFVLAFQLGLRRLIKTQ